jgi:hypothetical protein
MPNEKQPLERASLEAYGGIVCGIVGALMTSWWIKAVLLVLGVALLTHAVFRSSRTIAWKTYAKVSLSTALAALLIAIGWGSIWNDLHKQYPNIAFHSPITFGASDLESPTHEPPDLPPLDLPGAPLSKLGKVLYLCPFPPKVSASDRDAVKAAIRKNAEIYGNALGVSFTFNEIPYGVRFDITPNTSEGELRMNGIQRATVQLESASQGIFVTLSMGLIGGMAILEAVGVDRGSDLDKLWTNQVEKIVGAQEGKCRLL